MTAPEAPNVRALEPIGRTLLFSPSCRVHPTGIEWLRIPTDEELHADDFLVQRCAESSGWWIGDMVCALHKLQGQDQSLSTFAAEYAKTRDMPESTVIEYAAVCNFYPLSGRANKPLTYSHHRIIWGALGGGPIGAAIAWLKRAAKGDNDGKPWSTGRLREELSADKRRTKDIIEPTAPTGDYEALIKLELWSSQSLPRLSAIDANTARDLLSHMPNTIVMLDTLRVKAGDSLRQNLPR